MQKYMKIFLDFDLNLLAPKWAILSSILKGLRMVARALWKSEARRVVPWSETLHEP